MTYKLNRPALKYSPSGVVPTNARDLGAFLQRELAAIAEAINQEDLLRLEETNVAPDKPLEGDIRRADGTNWDPGSGQGIYWYDGTSWNKL